MTEQIEFLIAKKKKLELEYQELSNKLKNISIEIRKHDNAIKALDGKQIMTFNFGKGELKNILLSIPNEFTLKLAVEYTLSSNIKYKDLDKGKLTKSINTILYKLCKDSKLFKRKDESGRVTYSTTKLN
jgi:hypothetical protein